MTKEIDWQAIRALFPATEGQVYLDTASMGPGPSTTVEAMTEHLDQWHSGRGQWMDWDLAGERVRAGLGRLLETDAKNVALMPALSAAAGQVAESLPFEAGANIVVGEGEFQSNYFPWANQARRGFEIRSVPFIDGRLSLEELERRVDEGTSLIAASYVQSASGSRVDTDELVRIARANGARIFLDATQALGAIRVPTDGIDYIGGAAYKWLLSPRGTAYLYTTPERAVEMAPLAPNWKTHDVPYRDYYGPPFEPPPDARRFDLSLAWPLWVGLAKSIEMLEELSPAEIEKRDLTLASLFCEGLSAIGLQELYPDARNSPIVSLRVADPEGVRKALAEHQVVAAVRGAFVRFAFHFFNDESDVQRALDALGVASR